MQVLKSLDDSIHNEVVNSSRLKVEEEQRLTQDTAREKNWKRWGPYLSERQWATVREDYSPVGNCWDYFRAQSRLSLGRGWPVRHHRSTVSALLCIGALER